MAALAALLPILVILGLMLGLRWAAGPAGVAGLLAAAPLALFVFGWGDGAGIAGVAAEAGFSALTILWIIFPALLLHELQLATGATARIRAALARLSDDPRLVALLIAWFFALFAEGAAGFGTPVALAAPLLVACGFDPARAVALALVGHAAGVTFGAIGTPVLPLVAVRGVDPLALGATLALLQAGLGWTMAVAVHRMASAQGGSAGTVWALAAATAFLLPALAIAQWVGPELPTLGGALVGGVVFALVLRRRQRGAPAAEGRALIAAAAPYLLLLALILASRLVPPLQQALSGVVWAWSLPGGFEGRVAPLYHPGTLLLLALLAAAMWRGDGAAALRGAASRAASKLPGVLLALLAMLLLARLMVHSGMIAALAEGAAGFTGGAWPVLAPAAGALGTFVTGSATASNILLADFQAATAEALGLPLLLMLAAQGLGAAIGNAVCPHNVVAGAATVGLGGRETGAILRRTLGPALLYLALAGGALLGVSLLQPP
jgi:lactate permease